MTEHSAAEEISDIVSSQNNSKSRVAFSLELIINSIAGPPKTALASAKSSWKKNAPVGLQLEAQFALNTITSPSRVASKYVKNYLDNFVSPRYFVYQLIGGCASVGTKVLLPSLGIFDDAGYWNQLWLTVAASVGHTAIQLPAYLILEHRKYGQPMKELCLEYGAWRSLEALILNAPVYFISAGQANIVEHKFGIIGGAVSTSFISPGKIFNGWLGIPIMQAIYRRLQIRKEQGIHTDGKEVYYIIRNGVTTAANTISGGVYNHAVRPANSYIVQPIKALFKK